MSDRQDRNVLSQTDEHDTVREVMDWQTSHIRVCNARNDSSGQWKPLEMFERPGYFGCKSRGHFGVAFSIPRDRLSQVSSRPRAEARLQRESTSR